MKSTADTVRLVLKVGRVAIISRGRYAGKKVVIIQPVDQGTKSHPFPHALVAGIERYPQQVTRRMSKGRQAKRSKVKPFIKVVNYNHIMPTRYTLELEGLKGAVTNDTFKEVSQREDAKKNIKKALEERYQSGKNKWFFTPLSMMTLQSLSHTDTQTNMQFSQDFEQLVNAQCTSWLGESSKITSWTRGTQDLAVF
ncbi:hypothetical protein E4T44_10124 [Aureobasidium sp. EXF-8845]|nr:hypothetical protein E4T44_10124 [Aureobasidium sp. EXF-8845]